MSKSNEALERCWAIEQLLETVLPALIAGSPNRDRVVAALEPLAALAPEATHSPEEEIAVELADDLLRRLRSL